MNLGAHQAILFVLLTVDFNLSVILPFIVKYFCLSVCETLVSSIVALIKLGFMKV